MVKKDNKDLELEEVLSRGKNQKKTVKPSLSAYKEPELMPVREKEVLSRKEQKAKELLKNDAKRHGVKLDIGDNPTYNYGKTINPATPKEKQPDNIAQSARNLQSDDPAIAAKGFVDLKGKAPQQEVPKLDSAQLMKDAKLQRKLRWSDALVAFGTGLQGGTYDHQNSRSAQIQRKRDEQFQEYKNIADNNKKVKEVWDAKNRDELINFLETQKKNRELTEREETKLAEARFYKERDFALKAPTEAEKIKSGYYNKRTSAQKANPKANLPFESEAIINEMNEISGGGAGVPSRNQKRLEELIARNPDGYKTMLEVAGNSSKLRKQLTEKKKLYNDAIKEGNSVTAPQLQADIDELTAQLEEYQNNIKSILNGKAPAAKQDAKPQAGDKYPGAPLKLGEKLPEQSKTQAPETQKKLDDFFN